MNTLIVLAHPEPRSFNGALRDTSIELCEARGDKVQVLDLYQIGFDPLESPVYYDHLHNSDGADFHSETSHGEAVRDDTRHEPSIQPSRFFPLDVQRHHAQAGTLPTDVQHSLALLDWADCVIFHYPLWWHAMPAILKGWWDRVFVYGGVYNSRQRYDQGYFAGKQAICVVTTGSPESAFLPGGRGGDMATLMWPMHCSLYYVGFEVLPPYVAYGVQGGGIQYQDNAAFQCHLEQQRVGWAERLEHWDQAQPIPFSGWQDWDERGRLLSHHPLYWRVG